jgi:hypothetical protein
MEHKLYQVTGFAVTNDSSLTVTFVDGTSRLIDLRGVMYGELYGPLRDPEFFRQVKLDEVAHTLVWPNGADFDPATLYDWNQLRPIMEARARQWGV